jgi:perosamine synthetase
MNRGRVLPPAATPIGIRAIVSGVCGMLRGQKELDRFEAELRQHFGVKHCYLVSSGKAAFALILLALKELSPGRQDVLIPAFTCYSVPACVIRAGLRIRLCDLQVDSLDFDFAQLSTMFDGTARPQHVGPTGLLAVVPTHLFGVPSDVARLRELIQGSGVSIVEDAAQAMGVTPSRRGLGTLGDVSFFSLGRGKAFSTVEGGIILTDRDDLAEGLTKLMGGLPRYSAASVLKLILQAAALAIFIHPRLYWLPRSLPALKLGQTLFEPDFPILKMSSFQAGLAREWPRRLEKLQDVRTKNVARWMVALGASRKRGLGFLKGQSLSLLRFPVRLRNSETRESVLHESVRKGMGIMPVYPTSINAIPELRGKVECGAFPIAERCANELVTLPTHGYLTENDVREIGRVIAPAL